MTLAVNTSPGNGVLPNQRPAHDDIIWMETFSALLALCAGKSPITGEFPAQRPVTRGIDVFFYLRLNERLSKQSKRRD